MLICPSENRPNAFFTFWTGTPLTGSENLASTEFPRFIASYHSASFRTG
ncbi:MAG TPA: hypothetical protein DEB17_03310 [Chlorobaculum sp.]|uniref:Uncharacterized protein n=1 Tax=Chlorobaculum tepidum (strain ATCC 49652 / DSM 12025 / NBRC 103806 / TLS) TaxID=194439 RepID=Q8KDM2_CHLTE|nr:hypothetical protein CT1024 [Chlorobaculum tepidum TLS]HBU23014.1 hypothetical protein [Chlorobaculum sp.]